MKRFVSRGAVQRKKDEEIQRKMEVGQSDDKQETEADAVADRVMRMPEDESVQMQSQTSEETMQRQTEEEQVSMQPMEEEEEMMQPKMEEGVQRQESEEESIGMKEDETLRRKDDEEQVSLERMEGAEEEEAVRAKEEEVHRKPAIQKAANGKTYAAASVVKQIHKSKGGGRPMPPGVQEELGRKMGADFSKVRVHTDADAEEMNQQLGAKAFTHGKDIFFNRGNYQPDAPEGQRLLAHELTHTIQQGAAKRGNIQKKDDDVEGSNA